MTPKQELKLIIDRLKTAGKGIILLHDSKARTAAMLPGFLRYLRDHHYRVVHLVPTGARDRALTAFPEGRNHVRNSNIKAAVHAAARVMIG